MSDLVQFSGANLPSVADLKNLAGSMRSVKITDDSAYVLLKLDKTAKWVIGSDKEVVEPGIEWAVNPMSATHGYICWAGREVLGELMVPVTQPLPERPPIPKGGEEKGWEMSVSVSLRCLSEDYDYVNVLYKNSSHGGKKAIQSLLAHIADRIDRDPVYFVPIVVLDVEEYDHKRYGQTFNPIFKIVGWMDMHGNTQDTAPKTPPRAAARTETARRRPARREEAQETTRRPARREERPEPTQQTTRRRRPEPEPEPVVEEEYDDYEEYEDGEIIDGDYEEAGYDDGEYDDAEYEDEPEPEPEPEVVTPVRRVRRRPS